MTERRVAALAIGLFSLAFVAGGMLLGETLGTLGDHDPTFVEHYASAGRRAADIAGGAALIVAGASFLVFAAALRASNGRGGLALDVFSHAGVAFSVLLVVAAALFMATPVSMSFGRLFDDTGQFAGGHISVLPQAATVLLLAAAYPIGALAVGALAIASRQNDLLPTWHQRLGFVCAAVMPLAFFFLPILALPIWSVVTTLALWRRAPTEL